MLTRKTVLEFESTLAHCTNATTQRRFRDIKRKATGFIDSLERRQSAPATPPTADHSAQTVLLHALYIFLVLLFVLVSYYTFDWHQSMIESAFHLSDEVLAKGTIMQKVGTQILNLALASVTSGVSIPGDMNYAYLISLLNMQGLDSSHSEDFLNSGAHIQSFRESLLSYNLCRYPSNEKLAAIADLCTVYGQYGDFVVHLNSVQQFTASSFVEFQFPDPNAEKDKGTTVVSPATLLTLTKNKMTEILDLVQSESFLSQDPDTFRSYIASSLQTSNWLFVWSGFVVAAVVVSSELKLVFPG